MKKKFIYLIILILFLIEIAQSLNEQQDFLRKPNQIVKKKLLKSFQKIPSLENKNNLQTSNTIKQLSTNTGNEEIKKNEEEKLPIKKLKLSRKKLKGKSTGRKFLAQGSFNCPFNGYYGIVPGTDCTQFYQCANQFAFTFSCGPGLKFDINIKVCNFANQVVCGSTDLVTNPPPTPTPPPITPTPEPPSSDIIGYWRWSWKSSQTPAGTNLDICFSGFTDVSNAKSECNMSLKGIKVISFGGGNNAGSFSESRISVITNAIKNNELSQYNGIAYDIEEGDSGLYSAFAQSFAAAKSKGFLVIVTTSFSQPYGVSDGKDLMRRFFSDSNIDYISPQLYQSGTEGTIITNIPKDNVQWSEFSKSKAKIIPSIVDGPRDYSTAKNFFSQYGITLAGYIQWKQGI